MKNLRNHWLRISTKNLISEERVIYPSFIVTFHIYSRMADIGIDIKIGVEGTEQK
jgi:hypothetical protein